MTLEGNGLHEALHKALHDSDALLSPNANQ